MCRAPSSRGDAEGLGDMLGESDADPLCDCAVEPEALRHADGLPE